MLILWSAGVVERHPSRRSRSPVPGGAPEPGDRAARVLVLLDHLARLLATRGVELPRCGAGPVRLLVDRLERFGEVFYLTKSSPPLRADIASLAL